MIPYETVKVTITPLDAAIWSIKRADPSGKLFAVGPCPACKVPLALPVTMRLTTTASAGYRDAVTITRTFHCACAEEHSGRPAVTPEGCGRSWSLTIVQEGSVYKVVPGDQSLEVATLELERVASGQVTALQTAGEKWIAGVTAILGLLGVSGIAFGKDAVAGLTTPAKTIAVTLLGLAVIAAVTAVYFAYAAAYGWPKDIDVSNDQKLRKWYESWTGRASAIAVRIRYAVTAAITALAFLVITVGVIWFGGKASPPSPNLSVSFNVNGETNRPGIACGLLVSSKAPEIRVKVTTGGRSETMVIPINWVTGLSPVEKC